MPLFLGPKIRQFTHSLCPPCNPSKPPSFFLVNERWRAAKDVLVIVVADCVAVVTQKHMVTSERLKIHDIYSTTLPVWAQWLSTPICRIIWLLMYKWSNAAHNNITTLSHMLGFIFSLYLLNIFKYLYLIFIVNKLDFAWHWWALVYCYTVYRWLKKVCGKDKSSIMQSALSTKGHYCKNAFGQHFLSAFSSYWSVDLYIPELELSSCLFIIHYV